jgi:hypothetical protein
LLILKKHQHWKKVSGWIKMSSSSPIYFSNKQADDWREFSTFVAFPLEEGETLESSYLAFAEFDINTRATNVLRIEAVKQVVIVE